MARHCVSTVNLVQYQPFVRHFTDHR